MQGDGLPFYQGKTDFGATYPTPRIYCREPKKLAEAGDILMSVRAPVGATNICHGKSCIGRGIAAIRPKGIDRDFLYFYLKKIEAYVDGLGSGAIFKAINKSQLAELPINQAGIPRPEQKKIAHVLSTVQRAIEAQERIIQTTTELKKTLMHKLFTEGLRNEPQKQTEIGPVPESWEVVELNQLADLKNGYAFKSKDYVVKSNTLNIRMSNIRPGAQFDLAYKPRFLPDQFADSHKPFLLKDGDLIIAMTDMANNPKILGIPTIVRNPSNKRLLLNQRVGKLIPTDNSKVNFEFLHFYLSRKPVQCYLISCAKKGVQVNIGKKDILSVPITFPNLEEQDTIVQCFNTLDDKVGAVERKSVALHDLFCALLHELMTANIRVDEFDINVSI